MRVEIHSNPTAFHVAVAPLLLDNEAENNIMLGALARLLTRTPQSLPETDTPVLITVHDNGSIVGAAMHTPPNRVLLTRQPDDAVNAVADALTEIRPDIAGVSALKSMANAFADAWRARNAVSIGRTRNLWLYALDTLTDIPLPPGNASFVTPDDYDRMVDWAYAFGAELDNPQHNIEAEMRDRIEQRAQMFWHDNGPVATAAYRHITATSVRVIQVYTPRESRRRGYASGVVHALTKHLLDSGRTSCYLFTDADDPGPNAVYPRIGYRRLDDFADYQFIPR